ncbi:MAG: DUF4402 domain-containing protein [Bacteroidales bacterium]
MKTIKFFAIAALFLGFSVNAMAQQTGNATATAGATIVSPLSISNSRNLDFGTIVANSENAGTVTLAATSDATSSATGVTMAPSSVSNTAVFAINGDANRTFNITMPATVTLAGPDNAEMIITLAKNLDDDNNVLTGGTSTLYVGGSLAVAANQAAGAYTAEFNVAIAYE